MASPNVKRLAGYGYTLIIGAMMLFSWVFHIEGYHGPWASMPFVIKVWWSIAFPSSIGFWIWMFADFLSHKDVKSPVLVGFSFLMFNLLAALMYFWLVVNRRKPSNPALEATRQGARLN